MTCQIVGCDGKRQQTFVSRHFNSGRAVEVCDHHYVELQKIGPTTETHLEVEADAGGGQDDAGFDEADEPTGAKAEAGEDV